MVVRTARGERGSWFATVNGERLPCVHKYWLKDGRYRALRAPLNDPKHIDLVTAIRAGRKVILTKDKVQGDGLAFERDGYISVWRVDDIVWENDTLEFRFVEKVDDLK